MILDVDASSKEDVIQAMANRLDQAGRLNDKKNRLSKQFGREKVGVVQGLGKVLPFLMPKQVQ